MAVLLFSIFLALKKNFLQNSCAQKILIRELCQKKMLWLYIKLFATHSGIRTFL